MAKGSWKDWAQEWGLTYQRPGLLSPGREWMAGVHRGYLVKFGWVGDRHLEFYAVIRFPKVPDPAALRQRLLADPALADVPGWSKIKPADPGKTANLVAIREDTGLHLMRANLAGQRPLLVEESSLVWTRPSPWRRPGADQLKLWTEKLMISLAGSVPPFEGRCEQCGTSVGERFVMVNDIPVRLCEACQEDLVQKGRIAEAAYEQGDANHVAGLVYAAGAAMAGGAAWAAITFATSRIYALAAIGIAMLVGFAYKAGAKKLDRTGQMIGVLMTLAGVVFGDILFYTSLIMKQKPELGFRIDLGFYVFVKLVERNPTDVLLSLLFGAVGSLYVARFLARPRFVPRFEVVDQTRAAA
jgi:hypothetical protein